ncbi:hypothetical protein [Metabacillus litoralis]|uniref:hypothetical protein n=1 Tax=Metabacillus litoralis TaxID=152268 RepID=UPI000EF57289|nr:hypothetical protein [Metabacillus litoralis]
MNNIKTYLVIPRNIIDQKLGRNFEEYLVGFPEVCYISFNQESEVKKLIEEDLIDSKHLEICINIEFNNNILLDHNFKGLNLWEDIIDAVIEYQEREISEVLLGIDPNILRLTKQDEIGNLKWEIFNEYDPADIYYSGIVNSNEYLFHLIVAAKEFYNNLKKYSIFTEIEYNESISEIVKIEENLQI